MYKFSIISYFDKETTRDIRAIQESLSGLTGSEGCLTAWAPHITVGSGIAVEESQLDIFCNEIENFLMNVPVTIIKTRDYSFMDNWSGSKLGFTPYVVYIKPIDCGTLPHIASFFETIVKVKYTAWYDQPWPYNPHITVAYKDLHEKGYIKAQEYLKGKIFERHIVVDNVCLAIEGEDGLWREFKRFELKR